MANAYQIDILSGIASLSAVVVSVQVTRCRHDQHIVAAVYLAWCVYVLMCGSIFLAAELLNYGPVLCRLMSPKDESSGFW